jgi:hypothetical protein
MKLKALALAASLSLGPLLAHADTPDQPFQSLARLSESRPAVVEASVTSLRMPTGQRAAMLGMNYLVALDDDWGFGPSAYGAAKGNFGGLITFGATAQRRWRLSRNTHLAASLYVGAGGGLSSRQINFGGGLMLRPEISLRTEIDDWYLGTSLAYINFPSGNVHGGGINFVIGRAVNFASFSPSDAGRPAASSVRTGLGFDEVTVFGGVYAPRAGALNRSGVPMSGHMVTAGAEMRRYFVSGSWWGVEAAGAAHGGADGYMEGLAVAGQDWSLGIPGLRAGAELGLGLGGGGNVDTGNGWLWRAGPTLRWQSPWGASLQLDGGLERAFSGRFSARFVRAGLSLPLDLGANTGSEVGVVREQRLGLGVMHLSHVRFKDGSTAAVSPLVLLMTHEFSPHFYGVAQAGSAAWGHAGAYSIGLFGLGAQSTPIGGGMRFGAEALVGAAGGGGVDVSGGTVAQGELWAQWEGERLRLRAGVGEWRTLRSGGQSSPLVEISLGYAYGVLGR